jgi:hypothetical protein
MELAPRDGSHVLLYRGRIPPVVAAWIDGAWLAYETGAIVTGATGYDTLIKARPAALDQDGGS